MVPGLWEQILPKGGDSREADSIAFSGDAPEGPRFELVDSPHEELKVALVRSFLGAGEIALLDQIGQSEDAEEIDDRDDNLMYKHHVWRVEKVLKERCRDLYDKVTTAAWGIDAKLWENIDSGMTLYPEIEYIEYDVAKLGEAGTINVHRDNMSQVSMVALLSWPNEFSGGINWFEGGEEEDAKDRGVPLQRGDAVFFFGDQCSHWITPVTSGRRAILQMELSAGWPSCPNQFGGFLDWMLC